MMDNYLKEKHQVREKKFGRLAAVTKEAFLRTNVMAMVQ